MTNVIHAEKLFLQRQQHAADAPVRIRSASVAKFILQDETQDKIDALKTYITLHTGCILVILDMNGYEELSEELYQECLKFIADNGYDSDALKSLSFDFFEAKVPTLYRLYESTLSGTPH